MLAVVCTRLELLNGKQSTKILTMSFFASRVPVSGTDIYFCFFHLFTYPFRALSINPNQFFMLCAVRETQMKIQAS